VGAFPGSSSWGEPLQCGLRGLDHGGSGSAASGECGEPAFAQFRSRGLLVRGSVLCIGGDSQSIGELLQQGGHRPDYGAWSSGSDLFSGRGLCDSALGGGEATASGFGALCGEWPLSASVEQRFQSFGGGL